MTVAMRRRAWLSGLGVWLVAGTATAQSAATIDTRANPIVEADMGDVDLIVRTTKTKRVAVVDASLPSGFKVALRKRAGRVEVELSGLGIPSSGRLELSVPEQARLDIRTRSGDVTVHGLRGEADVVVLHGDVAIEGAPQRVGARTTKGDIRVVGVRSESDLATVSGDVLVSEQTGDLRANTVSGDVTVSSSTLRRSEIAVVSGAIELDAAFDGGNHELAGHSGSIKVDLPSDANVRVRVETFSGVIEDVMGDAPVRTRGRHTRTLGEGAARLEVATFSGGVRLSPRRAD